MSKILIIEDNEIDRELYQLAINKHNKLNDQKLDPIFIKSFEEALKYSNNKNFLAQFKFVLCDLMLNGNQSFSIIKSINKTVSKLPIIVISSSGHEEDVMRSYESGATDFCIKPNSFSKLRDILIKIDSCF